MLKRILIVALLVAACPVVFAAGPSNASATCTEGTWNFRKETTGGCAYGHVFVEGVGANAHLDTNVTVHDHAADVGCVYLRVRWIRADGSIAATGRRGEACVFYDNPVAVQEDIYFNGHAELRFAVCRSDDGADTCSSNRTWNKPSIGTGG